MELLVYDGVLANDDPYFEWLWDEGRQLIAIFTSLMNKHK